MRSTASRDRLSLHADAPALQRSYSREIVNPGVVNYAMDVRLALWPHYVQRLSLA